MQKAVPTCLLHRAAMTVAWRMPARPPHLHAESSPWCRTGAGAPLLAAAGTHGAITVWHLQERRLATIIRSAHIATVTCLHFFTGEPVLMSAGADNAVAHWIFDNADGSARKLRARAGHAAPPSHVQFYGAAGHVLLTAAEDRALRAFSVIQDQQSRELSQARPAVTLPHAALSTQHQPSAAC